MRSSFISVAILSSFFWSISCSKTATISDWKTCKSEGCTLISSDFPASQKSIFVQGEFAGDKIGNHLTVIWRYLEYDEPIQIDSVELPIEAANLVVESRLDPPEAGWPAGRYDVQIFLDDSRLLANQEFTIQAPGN